jgi:AcrR family transcriptional regulator
MSRKAIQSRAPQSRPKTDARVRRTRDALGDALIALIQEKPFENITVQHILDRAHIGRSTFYVHYRDKDDLFLSDLEDFLDLMSTLLLRRQEASRRIAPVRELFAHVAEMRQLQTALVAAGKMHDFVEMGQGYFARAIERRLKQLPGSSAIDSHRAAVAHAFAGALLSLMSWWLDHGAHGSPEQMDDLYHQMVWSGIAASPPLATCGFDRSRQLR